MGRCRPLWTYDERARSQQLALLDGELQWSVLPTPPVGFPGPLVAAGGRLFAGTTIMGAEAIAELAPGAAAWTALVVPSTHTDTICPPLLVPAAGRSRRSMAATETRSCSTAHAGNGCRRPASSKGLSRTSTGTPSPSNGWHPDPSGGGPSSSPADSR